MMVSKDGHTYEVLTEVHDVTMMHRPDDKWEFFDSAGHRHAWVFIKNGEESNRYDPSAVATIPTVTQVFDHWMYTDDGERLPIYRRECKLCNAIVKPGFCSDENRVYIAGLKHYRIDGAKVSKDEMEAALRAAGILTEGK